SRCNQHWHHVADCWCHVSRVSAGSCGGGTRSRVALLTGRTPHSATTEFVAEIEQRATRAALPFCESLSDCAAGVEHLVNSRSANRVVAISCGFWRILVRTITRIVES